MPLPPPPALGLTGREADPPRLASQDRVRLVRGRRSRAGRARRSDGQTARRGLVAQRAHRRRRRPDPGEAGGDDRLGEVGVSRPGSRSQGGSRQRARPPRLPRARRSVEIAARATGRSRRPPDVHQARAWSSGDEGESRDPERRHVRAMRTTSSPRLATSRRRMDVAVAERQWRHRPRRRRMIGAVRTRDLEPIHRR